MNKKFFSLALALALTAGCSGKSMELTVPAANANGEASEGLSWPTRAAMDAYMRYSVWSGGRSGFVTMFARDGQPIYSNAVGWADIESQIPMQVDTRMRFASMTKPVTAVAAMILIEEGKLHLDDPVSQYIPAFAEPKVATSETMNADGSFSTQPANTIPLVRHLLMFSSGVGPGMTEQSDLKDHWETNGLRSTKDESLAERVDRIVQLPLFEEPGSKWRYGGSADVLARVVEVASEKSFDVFLQERIFGPLGMTATSFLPPADEQSKLAKVYTQNEDGQLILSKPQYDALTWTPGGSGLVSNAGDYMRFALMLWNRGQYQDVRILSEQTLAEMTRLHVPSGVLTSQDIEGIGWGLGMSVIADEDAAIMPGGTGDFGWSGYYGTTFSVSPASGLVGIVLSQNEPGEFSGLPMEVYVVQGIGFSGM